MLEQALALVFNLLLVYKTHQCAITTLSDCNCVIECNALSHCDCNVKPCRAILHWDTIVLLSGTLQTLPLPQCTFTILWQTIFNGFLLRADSASQIFLLLTSLFVSHILTTAPKMWWLGVQQNKGFLLGYQKYASTRCQKPALSWSYVYIQQIKEKEQAHLNSGVGGQMEPFGGSWRQFSLFPPPLCGRQLDSSLPLQRKVIRFVYFGPLCRWVQCNGEG